MTGCSVTATGRLVTGLPAPNVVRLVRRQRFAPVFRSRHGFESFVWFWIYFDDAKIQQHLLKAP